MQVVSNDGHPQIVRTNKEIVLLAGAHCSPAILMRSGLRALSGIYLFEIECKVDLAGVGKNLLDHLLTTHPLACSRPKHPTG